MNKDLAICKVEIELNSATEAFGSFASPHEGLAIIREEYKELEAEVFKQFNVRTKSNMAKEACQIAAMAICFMIDLC